MTNKQKGLAILGKLAVNVVGKDKEAVKKEIYNASKVAFELEISYFTFAEIHMEFFAKQDQKMMILSKAVRNTVEAMEDNRSRQAYKAAAGSTTNHSKDFNIHRINQENAIRFNENASRIHQNFMNGF